MPPAILRFLVLLARVKMPIVMVVKLFLATKIVILVLKEHYWNVTTYQLIAATYLVGFEAPVEIPIAPNSAEPDSSNVHSTPL